MLLVAVDDSACSFGAAAAIEGQTEPEIVSLRRLALGGEDAEKGEVVIAAVLLPLIAQREVQRSTNIAVGSGNHTVLIRSRRNRARRRLTGRLEEDRGRSDECHAADEPSARPK